MPSTWQAISPSSATAAPTWITAAYEAMSQLTTSKPAISSGASSRYPAPLDNLTRNPALAIADKTWDPHRSAEYKGGATVWDGFAYDPDLKLVYFGTANAAPYDQRQLGPAQGDALFAASILAVQADSGNLAWYFQTTPGDHWDYDAVAKLMLADLKIDGTDYRVIMQANKNGFF